MWLSGCLSTVLINLTPKRKACHRVPLSLYQRLSNKEETEGTVGNRRSGIPKGYTGLCYLGIWEEELAGTACAGAVRHVLVEQSLVINSAVVLVFLVLILISRPLNNFTSLFDSLRTLLRKSIFFPDKLLIYPAPPSGNREKFHQVSKCSPTPIPKPM